jgi:hypothetical protein
MYLQFVITVRIDWEHGKISWFNKVFHKHPDAKGVDLFLMKAQVEEWEVQ